MWRLVARNTPSSRKWRAPVLAVLAFAVLGLQCSFPHHTFFEEDCYNGRDDDGNALADCEDPVCKQKVLCVPDVPVYWSGPVVVWEGSGAQEAPDCVASGYGDAVHDALYSGEPRLPVTDPSQTCPICPCVPSIASAHCEARLSICEDSNCERPAGGVDTPYVVTNNCSSIQVDGTNLKEFYFAKAQGPLVYGGCQPQDTPAVLPAPVWDRKLRACDASHQAIPCGERSCLKLPSEPLTRAACVYRALEPSQSTPLNCPLEYPESFAGRVYGEEKDSRACSECACAASGLSCPGGANIGDFGTDRYCTSSRFVLPLNTGVPIKVGNPMLNPLYVKLMSGPSGYPQCTPSPRLLTGTVTRGQSVQFCCTAAQ